MHKAVVPIPTPNGWQEIVEKTPYFDLVDAHGNPSKAIVANLKGDGFSGIFANVRLPDGSVKKFAYTQTASGWHDDSAIFVPDALLASDVPINVFVGPLVGQGGDDVVILNDARILAGVDPAERNKQFGRVFTNDGTQFIEQGEFAPPIAFARKDKQDLGVRFVDLHGTGLPDVIYSRLITDKGKTTLERGAYRNTGGGWIAEPGACSTDTFDLSSDNPPMGDGLCPPIPFAGTDITGNPTQFVDLDGDGYVDLLYSYRTSGNKPLPRFISTSMMDMGAANGLILKMTYRNMANSYSLPTFCLSRPTESVMSKSVSQN